MTASRNATDKSVQETTKCHNALNPVSGGMGCGYLRVQNSLNFGVGVSSLFHELFLGWPVWIFRFWSLPILSKRIHELVFIGQNWNIPTELHPQKVGPGQSPLAGFFCQTPSQKVNGALYWGL